MKTVYVIVFFATQGTHRICGICQDYMSLSTQMDKHTSNLTEDEMTALCTRIDSHGVATYHVADGCYRIYEVETDMAVTVFLK